MHVCEFELCKALNRSCNQDSPTYRRSPTFGCFVTSTPACHCVAAALRSLRRSPRQPQIRCSCVVRRRNFQSSVGRTHVLLGAVHSSTRPMPGDDTSCATCPDFRPKRGPSTSPGENVRYQCLGILGPSAVTRSTSQGSFDHLKASPKNDLVHSLSGERPSLGLQGPSKKLFGVGLEGHTV